MENNDKCDCYLHEILPVKRYLVETTSGSYWCDNRAIVRDFATGLYVLEIICERPDGNHVSSIIYDGVVAIHDYRTEQTLQSFQQDIDSKMNQLKEGTIAWQNQLNAEHKNREKHDLDNNQIFQ